MRNIAPKVLAHNDMPRRAITSIELLLDLRCDVFLNGVLLERTGGDVDGLLLHFVSHVDVLDHGLWEGLFACCVGCGVAAPGFGAATSHGCVCVGHRLLECEEKERGLRLAS